MISDIFNLDLRFLTVDVLKIWLITKTLVQLLLQITYFSDQVCLHTPTIYFVLKIISVSLSLISSILDEKEPSQLQAVKLILHLVNWAGKD